MQPTSSPVKVGVIGIGNMGWHHARVLSLLKDANLIGVADPNEERGKLAVEQFQCEWFKDYKDLIPKVDAICIAVPTLLHREVGLDCLKKGTNVLIEKPRNSKKERRIPTSIVSHPTVDGLLLHLRQVG